MMTPAFTLTLMLLGWFLVALALLWGMMRIARRHPRPRALHRDHGGEDIQPAHAAQKNFLISP